MMVGLTDGERCLIHNLRVEKHCRGSERIYGPMRLSEHIQTE